MTALRTGITTGTCAAAAAKAAAMVLAGQTAPARVGLVLPEGRAMEVPILYARSAAGGRAVAAVRKDAGDDPDVTDGLDVVVTVWPAAGAEMDSVASLPRSKSLSEKPRVRHICNQSPPLGFGWHVASAPGRRTATTLLRQTQKRLVSLCA